MNKNLAPILKKIHPLYWTIGGIALVFAVLIAYLIYAKSESNSRIDDLSKHVAVLEQNLASTTVALANTQAAVTQTNANFSNALAQQQQNVGAIKSQLGDYKEEVSQVTGTVTTLQKLSKTDPELLEKYSKVFFLNENYAPAELTEVPDAYSYSDSKHPLVSTPVWPYMKKMMDDALAANIKIYVASAFRSYNEQSALKGDYKATYGTGTANSFSADQGYSEHQLGTTADFITTGLGGQLDGFEKTPAYTWLLANGYKYGFILSYPEDNPYYIYEPWHWRFVGIKLATDLHTAHANFYDWEQRKIDGYLVDIFD